LGFIFTNEISEFATEQQNTEHVLENKSLG